jgi:type IV secretion system protein VirB9
MHAIYKSERSRLGRWRIYLIALLAAFQAVTVLAEALPLPGRLDARLRLAPYSADQVYRLYGYVGYEIDLEFAPGEKFVGLGAGDIEGISFVPDRNHLFIKPKAAVVDTNLTILTNLRQYQIEYTANAHRPNPDDEDVMFAVRFTYPPVLSALKAHAEQTLITRDLKAASHVRPRNYDYWYCGAPSLKPIAAFDDGVLTTLRFGAKVELPAIFVGNADHSESLVNFSIRGDDVIIQRVVQRLILRRGKLAGCIVNRDFSGAGERLTTHTVSPAIERQTIGAHP